MTLESDKEAKIHLIFSGTLILQQNNLKNGQNMHSSY